MTASITTISTLLSDNFDAPLNSAYWDYNHWQLYANPSYYGRTQQRQSLPLVSNGLLHLQLDTYNPSGFSFYGTETITKENYSLNLGGIAFEISAHFVNPVPGIVAGMFGYKTISGSNHDEIDWEAVTNHSGEIQTNIYANEPLGTGHPQYYSLNGNIADFHTYRIEWFKDTVRWIVDGQLVRSQDGNIPSTPMALHLNIWAPDSSWLDAYSSAIFPVASVSANSTYYFDIDSVSVQRLSTTFFYDDPPVITSFSPSIESENIAVDSNIILTFSEPIAAGTGVIAIHSGSIMGPVVESYSVSSGSNLTISDNTLVIDPTQNLASGTHYFISIPGGVVVDLIGNNYAGTETYDFTTKDIDAPVITSFKPLNGSNNIVLDSNIILTFSEAIHLGTNGVINIYSGSATGTIVESFNVANSTHLVVSGDTLTIDPTNNFSDGTSYYVTFSDGSIQDYSSNHYAGTDNFHFTTVAAATAATGGSSSGGSARVVLAGAAGVGLILWLAF